MGKLWGQQSPLVLLALGEAGNAPLASASPHEIKRAMNDTKRGSKEGQGSLRYPEPELRERRGRKLS